VIVGAGGPFHVSARFTTSGNDCRIIFTQHQIFYIPHQIPEIHGEDTMDDEIPVSEYYENEWDITGTKPRKSPQKDPAGKRTASATEEYNKSTMFLASIGSWISGYLSH
jgi:hypothetical protein